MRLVLDRISFAHANQEPLFANLSASANARERIALIGGNGQGKSTLLRLMSEDLSPTSGRVENPFYPQIAVMDPLAADKSWGQAFWQQLTEALVAEPALLLLDEPTRHLDLRHRHELAAWLLRLRRTTMIVVSHDLDFLDTIATHTWHLRGRVLTTAALPLSRYLEQEAQAKDAYRRRYQEQQETVERLLTDIETTRQNARSTEQRSHDSSQRRLAKKVAKKASSRERRLEHWKASGQMLEAPRDPHRLRHTWGHVASATGTLAQISGGTIGFDTPILRDISVRVEAGDRIAIVGDNGSGKSSLLETLMGVFPGKTSGRIRQPDVAFGYVQQVFDKNPALTTWEYFSTRSTLPVGLGRAWLMSYGFEADQLSRSVADLSQGEQVKLQIAALSAAGMPILALDEPEHHLDWPSLEVVAEGLSRYPGTLLVISHQPRFLMDLAIGRWWTVLDGLVLESDGPLAT